MSTTKSRNGVARKIVIGAFAGALATALGGCATKGDGDGSESHFLCATDSDCSVHGANYRCVAKQCVLDGVEAGTGPEASAGGSGSGNGGRAGAVGNGAPSTGGGASGGVGAGGGSAGGGNVNCPPNPHYLPQDGSGPYVSPPGFVDGGAFGCYRSRDQAPAGWMPLQAPACDNTSYACTYGQAALPCGACSNEGYACGMGVAAVCDCGAGPFVDVYDDAWGCKCENGQWDCRIIAISGASCFICSSACSNETRSTPYTPGMTVSGSTGIAVSLKSSVPAPPAVGNNDWTIAVRDKNGNPITGATLSITEFMPDHGHGGVEAPVVTELGGGDYELNPVNFNMSGYWETTVEVQKVPIPIDEKVVIKLCVTEP